MPKRRRFHFEPTTSVIGHRLEMLKRDVARYESVVGLRLKAGDKALAAALVRAEAAEGRCAELERELGLEPGESP